MGISEQTLPARLDGSVPFDHLDDYLEYERREPMAATNNDDRERASLWARYGEESETSRVDVPRPDGTRRPNTIYQELNSYFSNRPEVARRESAKVQKNLQNPDKYQLTPQDRIDFVALVDARPKNYELIRRAVVVRKFLSEKAAGRLPMKYNIPGIDTDEYGGKVELDLSLAEKGILTSEALEILYGVGLHDLRSLQNASQDFGEVLEEYCMVQFILRQSDYEARITPLIEDLRKTTKEFAGSKGHSASAGRKRKRAIYALRDALREVF